MLHHLFEWLNNQGIEIPGSRLFGFITFRVLAAVLLSLFITLVYGKKLIRFLQKKQISESIREEGLAGEESKKGTPTMGGIIIIMAIIIPTLLLADLTNVYVQVMLISTVWLGIIGFIDDYLKLKSKRMAQQKGADYKKSNKDGLAGWFKILGQVGLGILVGATLYFNSDVKIWREYVGKNPSADSTVKEKTYNGKTRYFVETKEPITTIPFVKNHEFNYSKLLPASMRDYTWALYILIVIFIITAVSNGANLTDGLDGLATGTSALIGTLLGIFAYASGNRVFPDANLAGVDESLGLEGTDQVSAEILQPDVAITLLAGGHQHAVERHVPAWLHHSAQFSDQEREVCEELRIVAHVTHVARAVAVRVERGKRRGEDGVIDAALRQSRDHFYAVAVKGGVSIA